jgi:hypothetical protein
MQWKSAILGAAISTAAFLVAGRVFSGDDEPKAPPADTSSPVAEHEALKQYTGSWDGAGTLTLPDGSMAVASHQTGTLIMGGRFLQLDSEITVGSGKIKMLEFVGYDVQGKKYVHFSMEDDSTRFSQDEGAHDAAKKATVMRGTEPTPDGKERKFRYTIGDVVDGAFHAELFNDEGSGEHKVLEWTLKKQK